MSLLWATAHSEAPPPFPGQEEDFPENIRWWRYQFPNGEAYDPHKMTEDEWARTFGPKA